MLRRPFLLFLLFCFYYPVYAQSPVCARLTPENREEENWKKIEPTLRLIQQNKIAQLADKVVYPLKRQKPLPAIRNKADFIRLYAILFDSLLIQRVADYHENGLGELDDAISFDPWFGDIWFDHQGNIITLNYSSAAEQTRKTKMIR